MAYTSTDLTSIESAITSLGTGARVVSIRFSSGKMVQYQESDLDALIRLRGIIKKDIFLATATNKRSRLAVTSKGY